jgi:hypothetical protein
MRLLTNAALFIVSLLVTVSAIDFLVVPLAFPWMPLSIQGHLPPSVRVLAQSSKRAAVPQHYIAIVGDSYAQGNGDWVQSVNPRTNPPFASYHLLHARTGRDVVSFGAAGASSVRGLVSEPLGILAYLKKTWRYEFPQPDRILVYFYEGNDITDNLRVLRDQWPGGPLRSDTFHSFIEQTVLAKSPHQRALESFNVTDNFLLTRALLHAFKAFVKRSPPPDLYNGDWSKVTVTKARIDNHMQWLPDGLAGPALGTNEAELERGAFVFEQSLRYLHEQLPNVPITVVYIPSPLTMYDVVSPTVIADTRVGSAIFSTALISTSSDRIAARIKAAGADVGANFLDVRPELRSAAAQAVVHGPKDWNHLNKLGQEAFADAILKHARKQRVIS